MGDLTSDGGSLVGVITYDGGSLVGDLSFDGLITGCFIRK